MMQRVFVFPGQGSHSVGMLAELAARERVVADTFADLSTPLDEKVAHLTIDD